MKYIVILFLSLFLLSCDSETKQDGKIQFKFDFNISRKFSGTYYDFNNKKNLLYFADPITKKELKIFDDNGILLHTVNLKQISSYLGTVNDIAIKSPDTIIANSLYTNKLAFINRKGIIWKTIDLNKYMFHENSIYEISSSSMTSFLAGSSLIFATEWRSLAQDIEKKTSVEDFYKNSYNAEYLFKISDFYKQDLKTKYGLNAFYSNIAKNPAVFIELPSYTFLEGKILLTSIYSNKIFIIDTETLSVEKEVTIVSEYTNLGTKSIALTASNLSKLQELVNEKAKLSSFISNIFYNAVKKQYILILYHENVDQITKLAKRPFSIIVMDKGFKQLKEIPFLSGNLNGAFSIMTDKGLMIKSNNENTSNNEEQFYIYNF